MMCFLGRVLNHITNNPATNYTYNIKDVTKEELEYTILHLSSLGYDIELGGSYMTVKKKPIKTYDYVNPFTK